jgi:hypothetical protein
MVKAELGAALNRSAPMIQQKIATKASENRGVVRGIDISKEERGFRGYSLKHIPLTLTNSDLLGHF